MTREFVLRELVAGDALAVRGGGALLGVKSPLPPDFAVLVNAGRRGSPLPLSQMARGEGLTATLRAHGQSDRSPPRGKVVRGGAALGRSRAAEGLADGHVPAGTSLEHRRDIAGTFRDIQGHFMSLFRAAEGVLGPKVLRQIAWFRQIEGF